MTDQKKKFSDLLVRDKVFPEPDGVFSYIPAPLSSALLSAIVVLDTNTLLVPYGTGAASMEAIGKTYRTLVRENRLRIPGQVIREFASNRGEILKTVYAQLVEKSDAISISQSVYRILEGNSDYAELVAQEAELQSKARAYRKTLMALRDAIAGWAWDDPVSKLYQEVFQEELIVDPKFDSTEVIEDLSYRQEHLIPPGYKDAQKRDGGIGDYLIWKTILEIGSKEKKHLIFVSGDEKSDWRYQSAKHALFPRYELIDEYRRASGGGTFHMLAFAELLEHFEVPGEVVEEVRQEEAATFVAEREADDQGDRESLRVHRAELARLSTDAVHSWLMLQHPSSYVAHVLSGFPDIVARGPHGKIGYEVYRIYRAIDAVFRLVRVSNRMQESPPPDLDNVNIVFVADSPELLEPIAKSIARRHETNGIGSVSVGHISAEGVYVEAVRLSMGGR